VEEHGFRVHGDGVRVVDKAKAEAFGRSVLEERARSTAVAAVPALAEYI
jgi:hypothetical protein